jgi:hypothetical protein
MNTKEQNDLIESIDEIETIDELIKKHKQIRESIVKDGFDEYPNFHKVYLHIKRKENDLFKRKR